MLSKSAQQGDGGKAEVGLEVAVLRLGEQLGDGRRRVGDTLS
jgi:hypothetical protein